MSKNILVTSCGGDIGQSIGKILKKIGFNTFGLDISDRNAAQFIFDYFAIGESASNDNYIYSIEEFVSEHNIDVIIPVSEAELRFYTKNYKNEIEINGAKVLMSNNFSREIGLDKLKTCLFLEQNNLPFPKIYTLNSDSISYPIIAKPQTGSGSKNIHIVKDREEFVLLAKKYKNLIFQELLDGSEGEFTCCIFRATDHRIRTIILKRELLGGFSGYGEVVENKKIESFLVTFAKLINLKGSINVQLRIHNGEPVVFEINPRFSSTVLFRHMFGFKDLLWSIEDLLDIELSKYKKPEAGQKFYKGFKEFIK